MGFNSFKKTAFIVLTLCIFGAAAFPESWEKVTEEQRKQWNQQYDKQGLYGKTGMAIDSDKKLLAVPAGMKKEWMEGVDVAKTPPVIEFAPVRGIDPMYFPEDNKSLWSNWAGVTLAPNGKFYFSEGDHRGPDAKIYLFEYDPVVHNYSRVLDFAQLCGWDKIGVGDSKIHGDMGAMPDGNLWILTYWDPDPKPSAENYDRWPGSNLVVYDTFTGRGVNLGVPMPKTGWPYYTLDPERGIFFAVGSKYEILCYDVKERKTTFAGFPPDGIIWCNRCTLLDPDTGIFWGSLSTPPYNFVSFDPKTNKFTKYDETTPNNIGTTSNGILRGYVHKRWKDGSFWVNSGNGTLYKFWPDTRKTEVVGNLWADETYVPRPTMTEDGRFIYYVPNLIQTRSYYQPVVQFNTETRKRKVIAFIDDYYFDKYGYYIGGAHGLKVSADGSTLVINFNGAFKPRVEPFYGNPALMVVHIPESERK